MTKEMQLSAINVNILDMMFTLQSLSNMFDNEFLKLTNLNRNACYDKFSDEFYNAFVNMQEVIKRMLAEKTELNISRIS